MDRYKILDSRMVGTTPMMVAAKVVVDQAITAPPILATFYTGMRSKKLSMLRLLLLCMSEYTLCTEIFYF